MADADKLWVETLLSDSDALWDACFKWVNATKDYLAGFEANDLDPNDFAKGSYYSRMTFGIALVCDVGPSRVDPTPLITCLQSFNSVAMFGRNAPAEYRERIIIAFDYALSAVNRLTMAAAYFESKDHKGLFDPSEGGPDLEKARRILETIDAHGHVESTTDLLDKMADSGWIESAGSVSGILSKMKTAKTLVAWNGNRGYCRPETLANSLSDSKRPQGR